MLQRKGGLINLYIFFIDGLVLTASYFAGLYLYKLVFGRLSDNTLTALIVHFLSLLIMEIFFSNNSRFLRRKLFDEFLVCVRNIVLFSLILAFLIFVIHAVDDVSRMVTFFTIILYFVLDITGRTILKHILVRRAGAASDRVLLVTDRRHAEEMIEGINENGLSYRRVTAIALSDGFEKGEKILGIPVAASLDDVFNYAREQIVDEAVIFLPDSEEEEVRSAIDEFESMGIVVSVILRNFERSSDYIMNSAVIGDYPAVTFSKSVQESEQLFVKRLADILAGLVGSIVTLVLIPFIGLAIKIDSKGPVFFKQKRVGRNGRFFMMYKFRSMYVDAEEKKKDLMDQNEISGQMFKMTEDPRITKVGRFIRATSLDEFPQFFNILKGDMSLIGTRPPTVDEFRKYEEHHKRRLSMKPGLTGLWQVSGRSEITDFEEVVRLDCRYIDNWSLALDMKILFRTIAVVFGRKGSR